MASLSQWVAGARPRTLPAAVAPVVLGTAAAHLLGRADVALGILALVVALALQVGVNYANDYSDGIRGTDEARVGPVRLVGQRLAAPGNVKLAAMLSFGAAGLVGLALVALSGAWVMLPLGALAVLAAWRYTGGDNPYGYRGLGEVYVFLFFGLMATLGTQYTQADAVSWFGVLGAVGVGAVASAILVVNNLRDIPTDTEHGKRTLAVRLGDRRTRQLYTALVAVSVVTLAGMAFWEPWVLLGLLALPLAAKGVRTVVSGTTGRELVPVLAATGLYEVAYAVLAAVGVVIGVGRRLTSSRSGAEVAARRPLGDPTADVRSPGCPPRLGWRAAIEGSAPTEHPGSAGVCRSRVQRGLPPRIRCDRSESEGNLRAGSGPAPRVGYRLVGEVIGAPTRR